MVFDLEDSVEAARKTEAREAVAAFLSAGPEGPARRFVRINAAGSAWQRADLSWLATLPPVDAVVLPKTESAHDVESVGHAAAGTRIIPLIETSRGVLAAASIARADASIPALLFGAEDLTAEIGVPRSVAGEELLFARSQVVLAATAVGADAIDAVFTNITAMDDLRVDAARARALGFRGKMAIHPDQIPVINQVFSPTVEDVARAHRIVEAFDAAAAHGEGVIRLDNKMVDAPVVARARRVLALADRLVRTPRTPS